jgi:hypothetical protein
MRRNFGRKKFLLIIPIVIIALLAFGGIVMGLWNAILVPVLGVKLISFCQALGILVLSKILFGGFKGRGCGWGGGHHMWRHDMQEKWGNMSEEERAKFKAEWKNRCGGRWGRFQEQSESKAE